MTGLQYTPYALPLLVSAIISAFIFVVVWRRRPGTGVNPLLLLLAGITAWSLIYALEVTVINPDAKLFLAVSKYIGITILPMSLLAFSLEYTGAEKWLTRRNVMLLSIEPVLVMLALGTNTFHHLFWSKTAIDTSSGYILFVSTAGVLFWLHAAYSYVIMLTGAGLMVRAMLRYPALYRGQVLTIILGIIAPWIANGLFILSIGTFAYLDPTPFAFTFTSITFAWSMLRFRLLDIVPVARDAVIKSMSDAMVVVDRRGQIVEINPAALTITGLSSAQSAIGKRVSDILPNQRDLIQNFANVEETRAEISVNAADGISRYFELRISPLRNANQDLTGRVVVLRDISELKKSADQIQIQNESLVKANRELAIARREADAANILKSQFLATMSHELRTPLNAVIGYSQLQLAGMAGEMNQEQLGFQERILVNAQHLLKLINEVLDLSKIEAGRMDLVQKPFNLREFVNDVINQNRVLADQKGLALAVTIDSRLPDTLVGDVARLKQVVINLLSNAIKFTEKGQVKIDCVWHDKETWRLSVSDTGIGIPAHMQETIFDEFQQVDYGTTRQYGGTGLGLAIVRRLVILMGGTIRVNSTLSEGSVFTVTLPIVQKESEVVE